MKKFILSLLILFFLSQSNSFAKNDIDPIRQIPVDATNITIDNPRGKIKIRFIRNEVKSDTTSRPKGFLGKVKNAINMLLDVSDNPPFKVEIIREKTRKN